MKSYEYKHINEILLDKFWKKDGNEVLKGKYFV